MPTFPKRNTLDYNPDSVINASKKLASIQLENMKNPVLDPDQQTLSTLEARKKLGDTFNSLEDLAGTFHSVVLRIGNLVASKIKGAGRLLGGAGEEKTHQKKMTDYIKEYVEKVKGEDTRWKKNYPNDDRNSSAVPTRVVGEIDDEGMLPMYPAPSASDTSSSYGSIDDDEDSNIEIGSESKDFVSLMTYLIQVTRRIDILINSKVKPVINELNQEQISRIGDIYEMVYRSYRQITSPFGRREFKSADPFTKVPVNFYPSDAVVNWGDDVFEKNIIRANEYADEILDTFDNERQKLLLDLNVVINSWRQNTPGQSLQFSPDVEKSFNVEGNLANVPLQGSGRSRRMEASGRNFYGEKVNNSRNIPTLLSSIRSCPTKYLL